MGKAAGSTRVGVNSSAPQGGARCLGSGRWLGLEAKPSRVRRGRPSRERHRVKL